MIDSFVNKEGKLFKEPYISIALPFKKGDEDTQYFPEILSSDFKPFYHQKLAFKRLGVRNHNLHLWLLEQALEKQKHLCILF